ncbi:Reticulon-domain-containing protein [Dichotomopilus funicola]|uniref:Reticulon-like protein n=1 Tax=Dichotomopilus funicola TaxID=1934379 RepID=A0AAN6V2P9_9PEZI|nr:Reticulon-domain-containing protein [Dichotomopilus funicola]
MADAAVTNGNPNVDAIKASKLDIRYPTLFLPRPTDDIPSADATSAYNTVTNGPVAQNVKTQTSKATDEMSNLAAARHPPSYTAATGQPLTNYHSFFSELLSWRNPRASAIAYASLVTLIFAVRYLDVLRWAFKLTWMVLGITIAAEVAGKALLNNGFATQLRPRKYYTIPRETLEAAIGDVHELINFFVIESQRVLFAENVYASAAAAFGAFLSYYLVKIVPYWGLAVIGTTVVFFTPLIYTSNQELIDNQLKHASEVVNAQTAQFRTVAQKHTEQATQVTKQYVGDYTAKAQALIKGARGHEVNGQDKTNGQEKPSIKATDFPTAPQEELKHPDPEPVEVVENTFPPVAKTDGESLIAA